jgi:hypothetical protein
MAATARAAAMMPAPETRYISAGPAVTAVTRALWVGASQVLHGFVMVDIPGAVPASVVAG